MWWFSLTCASGRNQQIPLQWIPERKFRNVICVEGLLHKSCMSEIIAFTGTILGFKMYRFSLLTIGTIAWLQGMIFKILSIIGFDDCLKQYPHWKKKLSKAEGGRTGNCVQERLAFCVANHLATTIVDRLQSAPSRI